MIGGELGNCAVRRILTSRGRHGEGQFVDVFVVSRSVHVRINVTTDSIFTSQGVNNQVRSLERTFRIFCCIAMASK
jgi:hypothetical protein